MRLPPEDNGEDASRGADCDENGRYVSLMNVNCGPPLPVAPYTLHKNTAPRTPSGTEIFIPVFWRRIWRETTVSLVLPDSVTFGAPSDPSTYSYLPVAGL